MRYRTVVADPPWEYARGFSTQSQTRGKWKGEDVRVSLPYPSMTLEEIGSLPIDDLADRDCRLFLWTTNRYLPDAFELIDTWGFRYRQTLVWHKKDGNMGGSVAPCSAEFLLVAVKGNPKCVAKMPSAVIQTSAPKQHSRKPEAFLDYIEQVSPGPYVELFSRRARFGWDYRWHDADPVSVGVKCRAIEYGRCLEWGAAHTCERKRHDLGKHRCGCGREWRDEWAAGVSRQEKDA